MSELPYMKWYPGQYADKTKHLDDLEDMAYRRLLEAMWSAKGKLQSDDIRLARLVRMTPEWWSAHRDIILAFFEVRGRVISHKRISADLAAARGTSASKRLAGKLGGLAKARKQRETPLAYATKIEDREEQRLEPSLSASSVEADKNANHKIISLDAARKAKALDAQTYTAEDFA